MQGLCGVSQRWFDVRRCNCAPVIQMFAGLVYTGIIYLDKIRPILSSSKYVYGI